MVTSHTATSRIAARRKRSVLERLSVAVPMLWLAAFFLAPFAIVMRLSLSQTTIAQPPYEPLFDLSAGFAGLVAFAERLSLDAYGLLASDPLYILSYLRSLEIAAVSTVLLLILAYPIAYGIARAPQRWQGLLMTLVILPFWTSFLIRVYAWMTILQRDGLLNDILTRLGIIKEPVTWLASDTAIYLGAVYSYLPFMILPIYAALARMDETLLEAAADLGCTRRQAFWRVTVPLSARGVIAGVLLCFIPIVGEFVIPDLLGGSDTMMIGQTLWTEFFANRDWPVASAVAIVLLVLLVGPILLYERLQEQGQDRATREAR
jgi:putrescine transport system permease protein